MLSSKSVVWELRLAVCARSRDGSSLLFESTRDGKYALYTINVSGTGLRRLTDLTSNSGQARWSADNKQIVFYSDRDGHLQLYLMDADWFKRSQGCRREHRQQTKRLTGRKVFCITKQVDQKWGLYLSDLKTGKEQLLISGAGEQ